MEKAMGMCDLCSSIQLKKSFCSQCDTILNHTTLYEYKHGKIMMHFRFIYESSKELNGPGEIMRYYRVLRGFSVRQLADMLHIVPATVLGYEQDRFPMPYETAVAVTEALQIPDSIIFDDFCTFISFPYTERLKTTRNKYKLSQSEFADRAGISFGIYSKWESGYRRPSRKMYLKLKTVYPEI